jgi:hypothetical protein
MKLLRRVCGDAQSLNYFVHMKMVSRMAYEMFSKGVSLIELSKRRSFTGNNAASRT